MQRPLTSVGLLVLAGCTIVYGDWEASNEPPDRLCCPAATPKFFQCIVALEGPSSSIAPGTHPSPGSVAQCFVSLAQAEAQALALVQGENPTLTAREVACTPTGCPGDTTDEADTAADGGT